MGIIEIVLIVLGIIVFIGSFLLPAGRSTESNATEQVSEEAIREMVEKEVEDAKTQIGDIVDETITYAMEKTERSMDRLTNEKMMAVNEYSDTVLDQINKSHKEVVFLYDMLNDKHENIKTTVSEVDKKVSEVKQTVKDAEILAKEVESSAGEAAAASYAASVAPAAAYTAQAAPVTPAQTPHLAAAVQEPAHAEQEFKPMEAPKVDAIYRPVEAVRPEERPGASFAQDPGRLRGMTASAPEGIGSGKNVDILTNVPAGMQTSMSANMPAGMPDHITAEGMVSSPEVEVTLNASSQPGSRNSNERILELHKKGKSNMAIAKELGLGIGEVKLVIDLFEGQ